MEKQIKDKKRVSEHGEVFTAAREVKAMLDLVKPETERIDSRFLEPACGDGNFLAEILHRKLAVVKKKSTKGRRKRPEPYDYELNAVLAISSIYGIDILQDNVEECRKRLFEIWDKEYTFNCQKEANDECREAVKFILERNILCGNALSLKQVDREGNDTAEPIIFSEWSYTIKPLMQRKDYRLDKLLEGAEKPKDLFAKETETPDVYDQLSLFPSSEEKTDDDEGELLCQYVTHYRKVQHYEQ